jgi:hypothetical protein
LKKQINDESGQKGIGWLLAGTHLSFNSPERSRNSSLAWSFALMQCAACGRS